MTLATLYIFGLDCHVGADKLAQFFKLIRIDTHVGVSPSALRQQLRNMENLLPLFQQQCENSASVQPRTIVAAMDETFFGDFLILVLMDLSSGYLFLEEISEDRRFDTWYKKAIPRLKALGIEVNHAVSDRAKALIKLAITGFDCQSGADLFHVQQDISKWLGAVIGRRHEQAKAQLETAAALLQKKTDNNLAELVQVVDAERVYQQIKETRAAYHENLAGISEEVHPFSFEPKKINRAELVISRLERRAQAFEKIAQSQAITDLKQTMNKFRNQVNDLAGNVETWWRWVMEILTGLSVDEATENWLIYSLLPTVYWHQQLHKTQNPKQREKYRQAWQQAAQHL